ncbi:hypothetical protein RFI_34624 [Reticulomyxa filosa]|uniref:Uncharacterized protein n=1 Tax=Reticulomyxa filosa TaxID=46433 RepID=X6LLH6_RETFI|nr:hypothetical protein RFI_34624 [Reticulomyxa filosa]|eukprot:ETO02793.1 hypothetical protein RFI_34624 [Reticulomyxa filosa]
MEQSVKRLRCTQYTKHTRSSKVLALETDFDDVRLNATYAIDPDAGNRTLNINMQAFLCDMDVLTDIGMETQVLRFLQICKQKKGKKLYVVYHGYFWYFNDIGIPNEFKDVFVNISPLLYMTRQWGDPRDMHWRLDHMKDGGMASGHFCMPGGSEHLFLLLLEIIEALTGPAFSI